MPWLGWARSVSGPPVLAHRDSGPGRLGRPDGVGRLRARSLESTGQVSSRLSQSDCRAPCHLAI